MANPSKDKVTRFSREDKAGAPRLDQLYDFLETHQLQFRNWFNVTYESFRKTAKKIGIHPVYRKGPETWHLKIYDMWRFSYFDYYRHKKRKPDEEAAKLANDLVDIIHHGIIYGQEYTLDIELCLDHGLIEKKREESLERQFEIHKKLVDVMQSELHADPGTVLMTLLYCQRESLEEAPAYRITVKPRTSKVMPDLTAMVEIARS